MAAFFGKQKPKLYKDILKDVKKIRTQDANNKHNAQSISSNLPQNLKQYSNTLHTVHQFWLNNIQCLTEEELNEIAMSIYCHLYTKSTPKARELLLKSNKMNIPSHTIKIFTIFEYAIHQIMAANNDTHIKVFKQLKEIGALHKNYLDHLDDAGSDIYELILDAFNYSMQEKFNKSFSLEISFCFNQFYRIIIDIMNDNDQSKTQHSRQMNIFLNSLEDCLNDEYGSIYFKKYLETQFSVENYLFYKAVQEYKSIKSTNKRMEVGRDLINIFIRQNGANQVNISSVTRKFILSIVDEKNKEEIIQLSKEYNINIADIVNCSGFIEQLFDKAQTEIFSVMRRNSWSSFTDKILEYCGDSEFVQQQETKSMEKKHYDKETRELIVEIKKIQSDQQMDDKKKDDEEIDILKQENSKLQHEIENLKVNLSEIDILKENNDKLQNEIINAQSNECKIDILKQNNVKLQDEIRNLKANLSEIDILKENNDKLQNEIINVKSNESKIDILKQNNDKLQREIMNVKGNESELQNKIDILQENNGKLQREIMDFNGNECELQKEIMNLKDNDKKVLKSKIALIESTSAEIDNLRTIIKEITMRNNWQFL